MVLLLLLEPATFPAPSTRNHFTAVMQSYNNLSTSIVLLLAPLLDFVPSVPNSSLTEDAQPSRIARRCALIFSVFSRSFLFRTAATLTVPSVLLLDCGISAGVCDPLRRAVPYPV